MDTFPFDSNGCDFYELIQLDSDVVRYVKYYGDLMRKALGGVILSPKQDGLFGPSCLDHTDDLNRIYDSPSINGSSFGQSLGDWYFHRSVDGKQLIDDCGELPCNHSPGCKTM
jgi:hypothetical protein